VVGLVFSDGVACGAGCAAVGVAPGFHVRGFMPAFWGAVVLALLGMVIRAVMKEA